MFTIYSSSAGSGKTYTLTKEYLKLALKPGAPSGYYRHILAVTFTNAAANEMKDRILKQLQYMCSDDESVRNGSMLNVLTEELTGHKIGTDAHTLARDDVSAKAREVFRAILHGYSDFSVTTIDSFTQRVIMAFTDELGLPYSFEVEMDTDEVLELAVDNLIEKAGAEQMEEITEVLSQYYRETAAEGESWGNVPMALQAFGKHLTSDQHYEAVRGVQELSPTAIRSIRQRMRDYITQAEADIIAVGQQAWLCIEQNNLSEVDFAQTSKGIGAYFKAVAGGDARRKTNSYHTKAVEEGVWYGKKAPKPIQATIDAIADQLCDCFHRIEAIRAERMEQIVLFECLQPHLQKLALLKQIRVEFDELLRKDGRVHISEFNKRILEVVAHEPVPFLYERLGNKFNHILIDEFQDTSRLQFANLLPLLDNALGAGHFNLAVGDGKQAIYRFRGGDMDQIVALHRRDLGALQVAHTRMTDGPDSFTAERIQALEGHLNDAILDTNWRSAEPIVRFNNEFFDFTARRFELTHGKIAEVFDTARQFQQKPAPKARPLGHVQIDFVQKPQTNTGEGDEATDLTGVMLARTVTYLRKALNDGYQYRDIAILCRKKDQAKALANELNSLGIPLVSADSLSLQYADSIRLVVTLMQVLSRPDQPLIRYEMLYLYSRVVRGLLPDAALTAELRDIAESEDPDAIFGYLQSFGHELEPHALRQLNAYELAEKLIFQFGLFDRAGDAPFLFRFLDEILTFSHKQSGHLADFLLYWQSAQKKVSVGEAANTNAVSIQTIHKSKGLEYPVVIIPFANWDVSGRGDLWLDLSPVDSAFFTHAPEQGASVRLRHAPVRISQKLDKLPVGLRAQYEEEMTRSFLENMNLLYVAFTRPTDRLYVIGQQLKWTDARSQNTVSYWLYEYLNGPHALTCGCGWQEEQSEYIVSNCDQAFEHPKKAAYTDEIVLNEVMSGHRQQELQLRRQADRVFDVRTFERTRDRDRKIVAALSLIKGPGCVEKTIRQLVSEGLVRRAETDDLRQQLIQIVMHPELLDVFNPRLRIDTDRSVLSARQLHGAPHRVVHLAPGHLVLVQYVSVPGIPERDTNGLRYFVDLYRQMGYGQVTGRLVYLAEIPYVVSV
ncbi:AAA family ATPase [Rudanella paleaurantiibacter]|uniref:DNA 3'-5' helicase n=1 Tax=Rudanella paleaurantiibacter TaxID=2614655 RepID=A0A7J5TYP9_9BACT|nr:UvrD-helicase domain-containing protein [Rudanella paleaurantiibacter]KAB7730268.1 AAA family ATPase [Rudanella paleaurantiibacter]